MNNRLVTPAFLETRILLERIRREQYTLASALYQHGEQMKKADIHFVNSKNYKEYLQALRWAWQCCRTLEEELSRFYYAPEEKKYENS